MNKEKTEQEALQKEKPGAGSRTLPLMLLGTLVMVFVVSFCYFFFFGNTIFFFQENQSLFVFSKDYLLQFTDQPGGLLMYLGYFFTQFYYHDAIGSVLLALLLTGHAYGFYRILKNLTRQRSAILPMMLIPTFLLLLMQTNFNWRMHNNLGFLLVMVYLLASIQGNSNLRRIASAGLFPLFYYLAGAYAILYIGAMITYGIVFGKGRFRYLYPLLLILTGLGSYLLFKEVLFFQPADALVNYPLSLDVNFIHPEYYFILAGYVVLFPLVARIASFPKVKEHHVARISMTAVTVVALTAFYILVKLQDPTLTNLFRIEKMFYEQDWDGVIENQERYQSPNFIAQYYYNIALAERGLLCDRLFSGRQDFGPNSLIIAWDSQSSIHSIFRGVYFFYSVGLINEAHRWAYESMVSQGYRPENFKLLIKTEIINGNYSMARKYLAILKKTLRYRSWAEKYEGMIDDPSLISADPEMRRKTALMPRSDFSVRIRNPQTNIQMLLKDNQDNRVAFEYITAWHLLEKNIGAVINEAGLLPRMSYEKIPRHIEEALLVYSQRGGALPDLGGLEISRETETRFNEYLRSTNPFFGDFSLDGKELGRELRNTLWFYLDYQ